MTTVKTVQFSVSVPLLWNPPTLVCGSNGSIFGVLERGQRWSCSDRLLILGSFNVCNFSCNDVLLFYSCSCIVGLVFDVVLEWF